MSLTEQSRETSDSDLQQRSSNNLSATYRISRKPVASSFATTSSLGAGQAGYGSPQGTLNDSSSNSKASHHFTAGEVPSNDLEAPPPNANEPLLQEDFAQLPGQQRHVQWGISWNYPSYMVLWALVGLSWVLGHHFYYQSLNGTEAGSSSRQNWAVRFGTAFAFLVVSCLRAACMIAYKQYIWTLFKQKPFPLSVLDRLFSATSDPTALFSWEFLRHAKVALFVAVVCW